MRRSRTGKAAIGAVIGLGALVLAQLEAGAQAPAAAQAGATQPRFIDRPETGTLRASKIIGLPVIGMDHVRVGAIEDVLVDGSGRAQAVVIGVGGFLGVGEKYVAVPFDQVAWNVGDVPLTGGPSSVATPKTASGPQEAAQAGPETMPGGQTDREVLGAVQNQHAGRVTEATGSVEPQRPSETPATVLAGDKPVHAEVRLTKAQLNDAPAFHFERSGR